MTSLRKVIIDFLLFFLVMDGAVEKIFQVILYIHTCYCISVFDFCCVKIFLQGTTKDSIVDESVPCDACC